MAKRGVWMLQELQIFFCNHGGSSTGVRCVRAVPQLPAPPALVAASTAPS